jgi:hypothetical protein
MAHVLHDPADRLPEAGHSVGPHNEQGGETMKNFVRRIAVVIGAAALSAGLIGATAIPAHADDDDASVVYQSRDTQWGG